MLVATTDSDMVMYISVPYLLVFKPLGLIYEVGLRFEFKPPGAYRPL